MSADRIAARAAWQNGLEVVEMSQTEVDALLEYSTTLPTGKTIGKQWKRYLAAGPKAGRWVLCEYVEDPDPAYVGITSRLIEVAPMSGERQGIDYDALRTAVHAVRDLHPKIENPRHGCCAPPKLCDGHPPECGSRDHGMNRPKWPCATLQAIDGALCPIPPGSDEVAR